MSQGKKPRQQQIPPQSATPDIPQGNFEEFVYALAALLGPGNEEYLTQEAQKIFGARQPKPQPKPRYPN